MTSLIEQAAQRLEQLRQAGVDLPDTPPFSPAADTDRKPLVEAQASARSRRVEISLEALSAAGIVNPNAPRSRIADQFRVIKRPLISNAMGKGASLIRKGNLIMVTSALPGEGKTFTAINLAMSMATELDYTVMLVDADVGQPSVMGVLGLSTGPGLLDLVLDESKDMSDMLMKTNVDKLSLLPSGTPHPRATELLASDAMVRLLDEMATRYADRIIGLSAGRLVHDGPASALTDEVVATIYAAPRTAAPEDQ